MTNSTRTILIAGALTFAACSSPKQEAPAVVKAQPAESQPPEPGREHWEVVAEGVPVGATRVVAEYEQASDVHKTKASLKRKAGASEATVALLKHEVEDNKIIFWGDAATNGAETTLHLFTTQNALDNHLSGSTDLNGYAETICVVPQNLKVAFPVRVEIVDRFTGQVYGSSSCR